MEMDDSKGNSHDNSNSKSNGAVTGVAMAAVEGIVAAMSDSSSDVCR